MNYQQSINVNVDSQQVFTALTQQLDLWWGTTDLATDKIGDEFTIRFSNDYFWTFKVKEFVANEKVTWECSDGEPEFNREWIGTTLYWNIEPVAKGSKLNFTHDGLTPALPCYGVCSTTWDKFITESLKNFLETGKGSPDAK